MGVCGVDGTGVVIPTVWASLGEVLEAAPSDFEEADKELTPSVTEQLLSRIGPMDQLGTEAKDSLVAAINEVIRLAGGDIDPEVIAGAVTEYLAANPIQETDPTVPAWAKQPTKPSYTAAEVGAVATVNGISPDESGNVQIIIPEAGEGGGHVGVEPTEDDIPKIFFGGALQQTKTDAVVPIRYISKTDDFSGYAEIKAQGNSSMSYPKKNQTVKMFADEACETKMKKDFKGWGKQNKHVYKANWIDLSHARNVVSARLWADVVKSRANYTDLPELLRTSPNQGAVDGFPVKVYAAGVYQGRYTLNIPKDKWTFNMDDELDTHCVLCGENYASGCFRAAASINGSDWTDEIHDTVPASIKTRWNQVISFVMNSTDEEFRANLGNYFYVDSLIDYYLFGLASCGLDAFGKNQIYATYDGQKWIASMYDMDSTWGLYWNGSKFVATDYPRTSYEDMVDGRQGNLLYMRLEQLFYNELQTRWAELKNGALSIENIINRFERFTDIAPAELVKEDYASTTGGGSFTGIPSKDTNNIQQIRAFALARLAWTDEYISALSGEGGGEEEPDEPEVPETVPCTGITLDKTELTFDGEGTQTITATVTPDGCTDAVTWESDDTSIATVSGGVVTAKANGSATITAKCGEYSAICSVTVSGIYVPEGTTFLYRNYAPNGESFSTTVDVDFESGDYIEASIDLTNCVDSTENIISLGENIDVWAGSNKQHWYYTPSSKTMKIEGIATNSKVLSSNDLVIKWSNEGMFLNEEQIAWANNVGQLVVMETVEIGSVEGTTRSHATYNYIKVVRAQTGTVDPEPEPEIPEAGILYALPSATTFNGTSDFIDTGVKLFDTAKDFTIAVTGDFTGNNSTNATVLHCVNEASPYPGLNVQAIVSEYQVSGNDESSGAYTPSNARLPGNATKFVITAASGVITKIAHIAGGIITHHTVNANTYDAITQNLLIGCYQTTDGTKGRFWMGTLTDFKVYNYEMTTEEVEAYLNA